MALLGCVGWGLSQDEQWISELARDMVNDLLRLWFAVFPQVWPFLVVMLSIGIVISLVRMLRKL